jgi:undecaprenyl-diphosphatase
MALAMDATRQNEPLPRLAADVDFPSEGDDAFEGTSWFERLLEWDEATLLAARRWRSPGRTLAARTLTRLGDASSWTVAGLALFATFTATGTALGLRLAAAAGLATLLSQALKRTLTRARPDLAIDGFTPLAANPDRFSFPSGHTAAAFAVAAAFAGAPFGLGVVALALAVGIAGSRVYLGAHYPLDVGAGALLGTLAGLVASLVA